MENYVMIVYSTDFVCFLKTASALNFYITVLILVYTSIDSVNVL